MPEVTVEFEIDLYQLLRETDLDTQNDLQYAIGVIKDHATNSAHKNDHHAALAAIVEVANEFGYQLVDRDIEFGDKHLPQRELDREAR